MSLIADALTSLVNMKLYLGITVTTYDALLEMLINNATGFMYRFTNRNLKARDYVHALSADIPYARYNGDTSKIVILKEYPINSVSELLINGDTIAAAESTDYYGSTGYLIYSKEGKLYYANGFDTGKQNVRVSYNAGYAADTKEILELELLCQELVVLMYYKKDKIAFKSEKWANYSYTMADMDSIGGGVIDNPTRLLNGYRRKLSG